MQMQADLVEAGFLTPGSFTAGPWDLATRNARFDVIVEANSAIIDWQSIIEQAKVSPFKKDFERGVFLSPDPASIAADVRNIFINNLGRLPTDLEMAELADELELNHRLDFEANEALRREEAQEQVSATALTGAIGQLQAGAREAFASGEVPFDSSSIEGIEGSLAAAEAAAEAGFVPTEAVTEAGVAGAEVPDVSPRDRLEASFFAKYGPLINLQRKRNDAIEAQSNLMQGILNMDALVRRGTGF